MKNSIKIFLIGFVFVANLHTSSSFATSIFWQCPIATTAAHCMFSNQDPVNMYGSFNQKGFATNMVTNLSIIANAVVQPHFTQYLVGSYFGSLGDSFYMTGLTTIPTHTKKQSAVHTNVSNTRIAALNIKTITDTFVSSDLKNSVNALFKLTPIAGWIYYKNSQWVTTNYMLNDSIVPVKANVLALDYMQKNETNYAKTWMTYNPQNIAGVFVAHDLGYFVSQVFKPQCFHFKTDLTSQSFGPVVGINQMQGDTYFPDNPILALHLITPGRSTTLTSKTSLGDVMKQQNTYSDLYAQEGMAPCGDNFGF